MDVSQLMVGTHPAPPPLPHFATTAQAVIWRNWELVPPERLAQVLETSTDNVVALAAHLGLRVPPRVRPEWLSRGYVTLIRANWHLLPYDQLLTLLGWTADQLDFTLREDDFLWVKLGNLKPNCPRVLWAPLSDAERVRTDQIRSLLERHFPTRHQPDPEPPFGFLKNLERVPPGRHVATNDSPFDMRLVYSYSAVYGDPLLHPELDPFPEGLLARLADRGVNGVWLQGLLYTLYPWPAAGEMSAGHERRLANLAALTRRAARYGIGVYLYLNEPRSMPLRFFESNAELKGVVETVGGVAALCTSVPAVLDYLRNATHHLFNGAPELAGIFTISMSENLTHCWSHGHGKECPRCAERDLADVIAQVNATLAEGAQSAKPSARVTAWAWGWPWEVDLAVVDKLPPGVSVQATSEEGLVTHVGGVEQAVIDYTISQPGPGPKAPRLWTRAKERGLRAVAKVQANNTWELSAVPWIPVPHLVAEHLGRLKAAGVDGLQLSWTLGGWPSPNLEVVNRPVDEVLTDTYGAAAGPVVVEACRLFAEAFRQFPFHISVAYTAPQNCGPRNLLYAEPTGYAATMVGFPYDQLDAWRAVYPPEVFENQFRIVSERWRDGLSLLETFGGWQRDEPLADLHRVATAAWCHFRSTYLQIAHVRRRERAADSQVREQLRAILAEELEVAKTLCELVRTDSRLGFEATNHYAYTANDLREKVLNCADLLHRLDAE